MTLKLDLQDDFLDYDDHRLPPTSTRLEQLGPWVECTPINSSRVKQLKKLCNKEPNEQKRIQFLATLNKQAEVKRKRFRTMIQKAEFVQKEIKFKDLHQLGKNYSRDNQMSKEYHLDMFSKYEEEYEAKQSNNKGKKALNTTMYVYEYNQPRKSSKLYRTTRAISFGHSSPVRKQKAEVDSEKQQCFHGSKNLQRILKMKQKIRVKNNYLVKKIKEKQIQSDKEITHKYLSQLHGLKSWKSITLDTERSKQKLEAHRFKAAHSNFKIMDPNLSLKRTTTNKYFN